MMAERLVGFVFCHYLDIERVRKLNMPANRKNTITILAAATNPQRSEVVMKVGNIFYLLKRRI